MHKEWFEPVLSQHLDRVVAPDELWDRVQRPARRPRGRISVNAAAVAMIALAIAVLVAWVFPSHRNMQSSDAVQVRAWVRANAGIDVPFVAQPAGVRLIGAGFSKGSVEIAYQVRDRQGKLILGGRHTPAGGAKVFRGSVDGHTFTLECTTAEDLKMACNLCHIG
jgi:hypothetical protein